MKEKPLLFVVTDLILSAIKGEPVSKLEVKDFKTLYEVSVMHNIFSIVYEGLYVNGIQVPQEYKMIYDRMAIILIQLSERQMCAGREIIERFNGAGVRHMPMKGYIAKSLYPKPEFRKMSDLDILVDFEKEDTIRCIMQGLGYKEGIQSDHEWVWDKEPNLHIELHKRLIPSYEKDMYSYYKDGWAFGKVKENCTYAMSDEDFFIYAFTHYAKHYRQGGIGILHVLDIWVLKKEHKSLDFKYIEQQLRKLGLWEFYNNTLSMISVWFEGKALDEITKLMSSFIFNSGAYGTATNYQASEAAKNVAEAEDIKKAKLNLYVNRVFLSYNRMCRIYPILKKMPIFLPFLHVHRIVKAVIFRRDEIAEIKEILGNTTEDKIFEYLENLKKVGLKY